MDLIERMWRRLAVAAFGLTLAGDPQVGIELERVSTRTLALALDDSEGWAEDERLPLLELVAGDSRPEVRGRVAASLSAKPPAWSDRLEEVLASLAVDRVLAVRLVSASAVSACLASAPPLAQLGLICGWATDEVAERREVLASALARQLSLPSARSALEQLLRDASPGVRRAAEWALHAA